MRNEIIINKFKATFDDWCYEPITKENVEECFQMALKWRNESGCEEDVEKNAEMCVTLNSLRLFEELELKGGLLSGKWRDCGIYHGRAESVKIRLWFIFEKAFAECAGSVIQ